MIQNGWFCKVHVCGEALLKDDDLARPQAAKRFLGPTPSALEGLEASSALINQTRSFDLIKQAHDLIKQTGDLSTRKAHSLQP